MKKRVFLILLTIVSLVSCRYAQDAKDTAFKEFKPSELLRKYEWFKDASAQLDKKVADIKVYESRFKTINQAYEGVPRKDWPREDREQLSLWITEVSGIKASYNSLSAEYNAQMAKFNWRFCNAGTLPQGATVPLPREYKPYIEE